MKWITIEQMRGSGLSEHYAYCNDDYYILEENADECVTDRLMLGKFLNHTITEDDIFEDKETGWFWFSDSIYICRDYKNITEDELVNLRKFVYAKKLD